MISALHQVTITDLGKEKDELDDLEGKFNYGTLTWCSLDDQLLLARKSGVTMHTMLVAANKFGSTYLSCTLAGLAVTVKITCRESGLFHRINSFALSMSQSKNRSHSQPNQRKSKQRKSKQICNDFNYNDELLFVTKINF